MRKKIPRHAETRSKLDTSSTTIIVEGRRDAVILRQLLEKKMPTRLRFFASQGRMSVTTLARNVLVHEPDPVVIVLDADAAPAPKVERDQAEALDSLYPSTRYRVFAFSPSLDKIVEDVAHEKFRKDIIEPEKLAELEAHPQVQQLFNVIADFAYPRMDSESLAAAQPGRMP